MIARIRSAVKSTIAWPLGYLEQKYLQGAAELRLAPIFIISLPRSGSTLFYLLLARYFHLAYFSNLASRFPETPIAASLLTRRFGAAVPPADIRSYYGNTIHWNSPSQAYLIWNRWLDPGRDYIEPDSLDASAVREMRATISQMQNRFGGPFCSKWQRHLPRLPALARAFPEAVFIYLERSPTFTAQSLLAGRREFLGDETAWLSARPSGYQPTPTDNPIEQVCRQVHYLRQDASRYIGVIGRERFFATSYESFCRAPAEVMEDFADWYFKRTGVELARRGTTLPALSATDKPKVSDAEFIRISETLALLSAGDQKDGS